MVSEITTLGLFYSVYITKIVPDAKMIMVVALLFFLKWKYPILYCKYYDTIGKRRELGSAKAISVNTAVSSGTGSNPGPACSKL